MSRGKQLSTEREIRKSVLERTLPLSKGTDAKLDNIVASMDNIKISVDHLKNFLINDTTERSHKVIENPNELFVFQTFRAIDSLEEALRYLFDVHMTCVFSYYTLFFSLSLFLPFLPIFTIKIKQTSTTSITPMTTILLRKMQLE